MSLTVDPVVEDITSRHARQTLERLSQYALFNSPIPAIFFERSNFPNCFEIPPYYDYSQDRFG